MIQQSERPLRITFGRNVTHDIMDSELKDFQDKAAWMDEALDFCRECVHCVRFCCGYWFMLQVGASRLLPFILRVHDWLLKVHRSRVGKVLRKRLDS